MDQPAAETDRLAGRALDLEDAGSSTSSIRDESEIELEPPSSVRRRSWPVDPPSSPDAMVIASASMRSLISTVDRVASSRVPTLVLGETGVGKELVSRRLHDRSPRRRGRFVSVSCATIPEQLVESTLFGHERGAFTGAIFRRKGLFELAHGGTLFLDEIGELPLAAQAALLRVLETGRVTRVGSTEEIGVDVRVVAATHRDIEVMVGHGTFREDLFFRLNTVTLSVPALREREEDLVALAGRFLKVASSACVERSLEFAAETLDVIKAYSWPGNVRELKNAVERAVVLSEGSSIRPCDLPDRITRRFANDGPTRLPSSPEPAFVDVELPDSAPYSEQMRAAEVRLLQEALFRAGGLQVEAARLLSLPLRTLKYRLAKLGIRKRAG